MTKSERGPGADKLAARLGKALDTLEAARPLAKELHRGPVLELALRLLKCPDGVRALYAFAPRFDLAGLFSGGDWARPADLEARLVSGTLRGPVLFVALEATSLLRILSIAEGGSSHPDLDAVAAREFLAEVTALNLDLAFPRPTEASRVEAVNQSAELKAGVERLLLFLIEGLGRANVLDSLVGEATRILAQRPILVHRVQAMLQMADRLVGERAASDGEARAEVLLAAMRGPSRLSAEQGSAERYRESLDALDEGALLAECDALATSMRGTGLVCPAHATLLTHLADGPLHPIERALGLDAVGVQSLGCYASLVRAVIANAIRPETAQAALGLAGMLERGVLFFEPVAQSLWRLIDLPLHSVARAALGASASAKLLAGTLSVLGLPLGVGQGDNPSCQAARVISLWAQNDPGFLLRCIADVARDDRLTMHFEGQSIDSSSLPVGLVEQLNTELDPVSLVLVPHLDRMYAEMGRRSAGRGADPHRWVNPELHGWWTHRGLSTCVDLATGAITRHGEFVRAFYAAYHPFHNGGQPLAYPQPAGIASTDSHGRFLGWHAIAIQRVAIDPDGAMRVYFYNPNNDGGQQWGNVFTSTSGLGERPGESSLPFVEFAGRIYLFHYREAEAGDPGAVPDAEVQRAGGVARAGWAAKLAWA